MRTEVTEPALNDLLAEIADMRDKPVPEKELSDAKRAIVACFALSLESPHRCSATTSELAVRAAGRLLGHVSGADQRRHAAQAQAAATKYWDPSKLQIVAVGDAKITDIMKKGPLEVFDADGKMTP